MKKMSRILFLVLFIFVLSYPLSASYASVPHLINYQGRLTDTSGSPLNGSYNITFRIYDAESAGTLLWQGTYSGILITKGIFNILLGDINDSGFDFSKLAFDKAYWLEIKVGNEVMSPRQIITSAGYAISAERLVGSEPLSTAMGGTGVTANANTAGGVVVLDNNGKLPSVDGSLLTGVSKINLEIDSGVSPAIANNATANISFNFIFASAPKVVISMYTAGGANDYSFWVVPGSITTTGFQISHHGGTDPGSVVFNWIAVGIKS